MKPNLMPQYKWRRRFCEWAFAFLAALISTQSLATEIEANGWKIRFWSDQHSLDPGGKMIAQIRLERTGSDITWQATTVQVYGDWGKMAPPWTVLSMSPTVSFEAKTNDPDLIFRLPTVKSGEVFTAKFEIALKMNDIRIGDPVQLSGSVSPNYAGVRFYSQFRAGNRTKNANPSTATAGDPVSTATGEFVLPPQTDLDLGGPLPLRFSRWYSSALSDPSTEYWWQSFDKAGKGWSHSFDIVVYDWPISGNDDQCVQLPSGKAVPFILTSSRFSSPKIYSMNFEDEAVRYELKDDGQAHWFLDPSTQLVYRFDDRRCVEIQDRNGNALLLSRSDSDGQVTNVTDGLGRSMVFEYEYYTEYSRRLASLSDGTRRVSFGYDTNGFLATVTNVLGGITSYSYDSTNSLTSGKGALMTAVQYPRGNTPFTQTYKTTGQVAAQMDAYGYATVFTNNPQTGETQITDPQAVFTHRNDGFRRLTNWVDQAGQAIALTFGNRDLPTAITDRRGATLQFVYEDDSRQLTEQRDSLGQTTRFTYVWTTQTFTNRATSTNFVTFAFRDLAGIQHPDGTTEIFARDGCGNVTNYTDRAGAVWSMTYNGHGQPLTVRNPRGGEIVYTYNADGTLATRSDSDTDPVANRYDALRRLVGRVHASGAESSWQLDALDRIVSHTNEIGGVRSMAYDANGVLLTFTNEVGHALQVATDLMDRWTNRADAFGDLQAASYDSLGRLTASSDAAGTDVYSYDGRGWLTNLARAGRNRGFTYDPEGSVTQAVSALGHVSRFEYDIHGQRLKEVNALGQTNSYRYDTMGRLIEAIDAQGASTRLAYDPAGRLLAATNALGHTVRFEYDPLGQLASAIDRDGHLSAFTYTPMGRLSQVTNAEGGVIRYTYDRQGRLMATTGPDGAQRTYAYDAAGHLVTSTDPGSNAWHYAYDARGVLTAATNPVGGVTLLTYRGDGLPATWSDADTGPTTNRYDAARRLIETQLPDGTSRRYEYNEHHELSAVVEADGATHRFGFDADGRLTEWTDPLGATTHYVYDAAGQLTNWTNRGGAQWHLAYDAAGRLVSATDPTGVRAVYTRDALGRITALKVGAATWQFAYNGEGVLTNTILPSGRSFKAVPDALQRIVTTVNAAAETNRLVFDAIGRATNAVDAAGRVTAYAYDLRGLLTGVTVPGGRSTRYEYNPLGLLATLQDFNAQSWAFTYTPAGRLRTVTDPLGRAVTNQYNALGRWSASRYADGVTVSNTYDAAGRLLQRAYSSGLLLSNAYDKAGRLTATEGLNLGYDVEGRITASADTPSVFGATYDDASRLQSATYNHSAFTVTYTYRTGVTGDGRLEGVSDNLTGTRVDFRYDADGRLVETAFSNGETNTMTWDAADRLIRIRSGTHLDLQYDHDRSGRITNLVATAPLDAGAKVTAGTNALIFDAASQISSAGYAYDPRGRMTVAPGRTQLWDAASRLVGIGGATLEYNGLGNLRVRSTESSSVRFHYNHALGGSAPVVAEQDAATSQFLRFYVRAPDGRLLYLIDAANGNQVYFYHFDRNGSTVALTDNRQTVTDAYAYDPYGRLVARSGSSPQPFTFVGAWGVRQEDVAGTVYQMGARYYDAVTGHFLSPEPVWPQIANPERLNPYQYAAQDPVRFIDPTGLAPTNPPTQLVLDMGNFVDLARFEHGPASPGTPYAVSPQAIAKGIQMGKTLEDMRMGIYAALYSSWTEPGNNRTRPSSPSAAVDAQLACRQRPKNTAPAGIHQSLSGRNPLFERDVFLKELIGNETRARQKDLDFFLAAWPQADAPLQPAPARPVMRPYAMGQEALEQWLRVVIPPGRNDDAAAVVFSAQDPAPGSFAWKERNWRNWMDLCALVEDPLGKQFLMDSIMFTASHRLGRPQYNPDEDPIPGALVPFLPRAARKATTQDLAIAMARLKEWKYIPEHLATPQEKEHALALADAYVQSLVFDPRDLEGLSERERKEYVESWAKTARAAQKTLTLFQQMLSSEPR